jgi:hypothetical protein
MKRLKAQYGKSGVSLSLSSECRRRCVCGVVWCGVVRRGEASSKGEGRGGEERRGEVPYLNLRVLEDSLILSCTALFCRSTIFSVFYRSTLHHIYTLLYSISAQLPGQISV